MQTRITRPILKAFVALVLCVSITTINAGCVLDDQPAPPDERDDEVFPMPGLNDLLGFVCAWDENDENCFDQANALCQTLQASITGTVCWMCAFSLLTLLSPEPFSKLAILGWCGGCAIAAGGVIEDFYQCHCERDNSAGCDLDTHEPTWDPLVGGDVGDVGCECDCIPEKCALACIQGESNTCAGAIDWNDGHCDENEVCECSGTDSEGRSCTKYPDGSVCCDPLPGELLGSCCNNVPPPPPP